MLAYFSLINMSRTPHTKNKSLQEKKKQYPWLFKKKRYNPSRVEATEWDVRLDVSLAHDINASPCICLECTMIFIRGCMPFCTYLLVSGIEEPDKQKSPTKVEDLPTSKPTSDTYHVHIAVIWANEINRTMLLRMLRGPHARPGNGEYAKARPFTYSYAGWYCHHTKNDLKLYSDKLISFEYGMLPLDSYEQKKTEQVCRMVSKFRPDLILTKFKPWFDAHRDHVTKALLQRELKYEEEYKICAQTEENTK